MCNGATKYWSSPKLDFKTRKRSHITFESSARDTQFNLCFHFNRCIFPLSILFLLLFPLFFFSLPYLSFIHEKSNFIAIFWTGRPHSLGSCHFQGVWAIYLPHKSGGVPLNASFKDTTSELAGLFSTTSSKCRASSREAVETIF